MKVTFIAKEYPPYVYGGAGIHLKYLSKELAKLMDVEVRCFGDQDSTEGNIRTKGYKQWKELSSKANPEFNSLFNTLSTNLAILADKIDSDVVHTHTWYAHLAGFYAKTLYNVPYVATSHSLEPLRPWKEDQLGQAYNMSTWMEKIGLENADKVVAVSKMMKKDIMKLFDVKEGRIEVIHNGVDINKWNRTPISDELRRRSGITKDYILFVGRPTPQKGMEYLVDASDHIDKNVQIVFGAVGSDTKEYEERLTEKVSRKPNIIWIHELLKEEEYIQLYSSARVFVCPSIYEPFGIINLEAMACHTPVVASGVGGILEVVVNNKTGLIIKPKDPRAIANAVNSLLKNESKAREMGENGRKRVEKYFSWAFIAEKTKKLYEGLAKSRKKRK